MSNAGKVENVRNITEEKAEESADEASQSHFITAISFSQVKAVGSSR